MVEKEKNSIQDPEEKNLEDDENEEGEADSKVETGEDRADEDFERKKNEAKDSEVKEDDGEININTDLSNFLWPSNQARTPVLERIAQEQAGPIFVGTIPQGPLESVEGSGEKDNFKYIPSEEGSNENKYIPGAENISVSPEKADFMNVGRNRSEFPNQDQESFIKKAEYVSINSPTVEKVWAPEKADIEKAGRKSRFEEDFGREEIKYKKYEAK